MSMWELLRSVLCLTWQWDEFKIAWQGRWPSTFTWRTARHSFTLLSYFRFVLSSKYDHLKQCGIRFFNLLISVRMQSGDGDVVNCSPVTKVHLDCLNAHLTILWRFFIFQEHSLVGIVFSFSTTKSKYTNTVCFTGGTTRNPTNPMLTATAHCMTVSWAKLHYNFTQRN